MNICRRCSKFAETIVTHSPRLRDEAEIEFLMLCQAMPSSHMYERRTHVYSEKELVNAHGDALADFEKKMHEMVCDGGEGCIFKTEHLMTEWKR